MTKKELQAYRRQLLLFITGVFLIGFLTGGTSALIYSSAKTEPSEVQKTTITNYPIVQRAKPSPEPTEAPEEAQEAITTYHKVKPSPAPAEAPEEVQETTTTYHEAKPSPAPIEATEEVIVTYHETEPSTEPAEAPEEPVLTYTTEEVHAMALTLAGECYENQPQDKRNVAWVICNRVADGRFGKGVVGVVSSTKHGVQFSGYWAQSRPISENDLEIAEEVLAAYYAGEESIHDYLYFTGGAGVTNNFK